jgi:hypothetical protein
MLPNDFGREGGVIMLKHSSIFLYLCIFSTSLLAMDVSNPDPVLGIDYTRAFDQAKIQQKYPALMEHLGCAYNVALEDSEASNNCQPDCEYIAIDNVEDISYLEQLAKYKGECLSLLNKERRSAILRPARENGSFMALLIGGMGLLAFLWPGSAAFGLPVAAVNCLYHSKGLIKSVGDWYDTRPHPVDRFEKIYAENKCYIPHEIWKSIEDEFLKARGNIYNQNASLSFLEFTLGLTVHKQKKSLKSLDKSFIINSLSSRIDEFFEDYEPFDDPNHLFALKASVDKFVLGLMGGKHRPRYIFIFGSKGLGKTYFARELNKWIAELFPNSTTYSEQEVHSVSELGGAAGVPGFMLGALRRQCCANTNGSVTLIDEAIWINDQSYLGDSLKVFEDSRLPLRIKYFGDGMDGKGIALKLPPMLTMLAGNKDIEHDALKSRFDFFAFPKPTKKALIKYAFKMIKKHPSVKDVAGLFVVKIDEEKTRLKDDYQLDLEKSIKDIDNFRDIESSVNGLVKKWAELQRIKSILP